MVRPSATDLILHVLRNVRATEGSAAAARHAEETITAAAGILACEQGLAAALATLKNAATATEISLRERHPWPTG